MEGREEVEGYMIVLTKLAGKIEHIFFKNFDQNFPDFLGFYLFL